MTPPPPWGPFILRLIGLYGFGKRSKIEITEVEILNLALPPESDPVRALPGEDETASSSFLSEDASPEAGLGLSFEFGPHLFEHRGAGEWDQR